MTASVEMELQISFHYIIYHVVKTYKHKLFVTEGNSQFCASKKFQRQCRKMLNKSAVYQRRFVVSNAKHLWYS